MKILVFAYLKKNLGDDIFLNILFKKYPHVNFYLHCEETYAKAFNTIENVNVLNYDAPLTLDFANREFNGIIYIAGSVFMEAQNYHEKLDVNFKSHKYFALKFKKNKKPFFYISCNFGPYSHKSYYKKTKKYLKLCTDVCFRDKYSFNMFKDLSNVRYAPDAALSYSYPKFKKIKNSVGISIIEPSIRWYINQNKKKDYYNFLKNNIIYLINERKKIYLFSYCEAEGDTIAQQELLKIIPKKYHSKINILNYEGNLKSYLKKYGEMEFALCGRFHSMILSLIFGHKYFVTAYSDKTTNVMNDFKIKNQLVKYEEISPNEIIPISSYRKINHLQKMFLKYKSKKQFKAFDRWLFKNK
ncbi:MAG: polysaccharide pyruvyl transferase family protein [Methanobacteriaceae archaeon]|jgi:colanic acid/amylovoran biosynthesis protein|nr:polysaccharide pyruvyl transferase family protein [Candidatus Methanorudis spinitermitis]